MTPEARSRDRSAGNEHVSGNGQYLSQFGEDRLLAEHFGNKRSGCCVEVGAHNGVDGSNTHYFEQLGWACVLVEADPDLAASCQRARPAAHIANYAAVAPDTPRQLSFDVVEGCTALSALSVRDETLLRASFLGVDPSTKRIVVMTKTLDEILEAAKVSTLDFVTIDVEGHEWDVLRGFTLSRWNPEILIIERNTHFPDRRIMAHMRESGYAYWRSTGVNDWFRRVGTAVTDRWAYRQWLFRRYYMSKYASSYWLMAPLWWKFRRMQRQNLGRPLRNALKALLERAGLLARVRAWRKH